MLRHAAVALRLFENLSRVARGINQKIRSVAMLDVYGRVARVLVELAVERDGKLVIPEKLTQRDIANRVGASREMINRILFHRRGVPQRTSGAPVFHCHAVPPSISPARGAAYSVFCAF